MRLEAPRIDELDHLGALCRRSKAVWGYDEAFMAACADILRVDEALVSRDQVRVARAEDVAIGVAQVSVDGEEAELDLLFVEPEHRGRGAGAVLFDWACVRAHELGATSMVILADPGARPFYERMGARFERMAPSDAIEGRDLPLLRIGL